MKRPIRIIAIVVGILIVIAIALPFLVDVNSFRPKLESELTSALGRQVKVGNLSLSIFSGTVSADNISIADDPAFSQQSVCDRQVAQSRRRGDAAGLFQDAARHRHHAGRAADHPAEGGKWEVELLQHRRQCAAQPTQPVPQAEQPGGPSGGALSVDKLNISNGRLLVGEANSSQKPHVYDKVDLEVTNFSATSQFPFTLTAALPGGGDVNLNGKCGPINAGNAAETPFEATIKVRKLDLAPRDS